MTRQLRFELEPCLFFGDNLDVLPTYVADESVDLVYLDPPFNSKKSYNAIFKRTDGSPAAAQIKAFDDTWKWTLESERVFRSVVEAGGAPSRALRAFRDLLMGGQKGGNELLAYLTMMAPRLIELRRVLKPSGSLFLHCDPRASHYLKVLLDSILGPNGFRNEMIWHYSGWNKQLDSYFERRHDVILFYAMSEKSQMFNSYSAPWESEKEYLKVRKQKRRVDENGRPYVLSDAGGGNRIMRYLDEAMAYGKPSDDVWNIDKVNNSASEGVGYQTQKPVALLERIIGATTNPGDLVLDPFCGCGTTIDAAQKLGRRWIGIDVTSVAIRVIQERLADRYPGLDYAVRGVPLTMEDVRFLAERDKYAFQQWACDRLGIDADIRKGADQGIDGEIVRYAGSERPWRAVVSVKGGGVNVTQVRDLRGTMERERADGAIFVSLKPTTGPMRTEALQAGLTPEGIPRIQLMTAEDLIDGRAPQIPLPAGVAHLPPVVLEAEAQDRVPTHAKALALLKRRVEDMEQLSLVEPDQSSLFRESG